MPPPHALYHHPRHVFAVSVSRTGACVSRAPCRLGHRLDLCRVRASHWSSDGLDDAAVIDADSICPSPAPTMAAKLAAIKQAIAGDSAQPNQRA